MAITTGTYAGKPGAPSTGDIHFLTDSFYNLLYYNGASWDHFRNGKLLTPPNDAAFSWHNQGTASVDSTNGGAHLKVPAVTPQQIRGRIVAAPGTPYVITAAMLPTLPGVDVHGFGLFWLKSSDGKMVTLRVVGLTYGGAMSVTKEGVAHYVSLRSDILVSSPLIFLRIEDDGTNRKCHFSGDGINFAQIHSVSRTDYLTADYVGWCGIMSAATLDLGVTLIHWKQT